MSSFYTSSILGICFGSGVKVILGIGCSGFGSACCGSFLGIFNLNEIIGLASG